MLAKSGIRLEGNKIYLRQLDLSDCTDTYVSWLNDTEVNQYLETKWSKQSLDSIRDFAQNMRKSKDSIIFAICKNSDDTHIGNIKIGPIHPHYRHADISYFIGEKQSWGGGIATDAIRLSCFYAFEELNLHRVEAGAYEVAIGSWKALEKNGFVREAVLRKQVYFDNKWIDVYRYGLLEDECRKSWSRI